MEPSSSARAIPYYEGTDCTPEEAAAAVSAVRDPKVLHEELREAQARVEMLASALRRAIRARMDDGASGGEIARDLGITRTRVHQILRRP